jgi:hypothetical protein
LIDGNRIYIDTSMVFERHNPNLPKTQLAHTFLIDKDRKVILIGDPLKNIRVEEIFNNIIRNNKNKMKHIVVFILQVHNLLLCNKKFI